MINENLKMYLALFQEEKQKCELVSSYDAGGKVSNAITYTLPTAGSWDWVLPWDEARCHSRLICRGVKMQVSKGFRKSPLRDFQLFQMFCKTAVDGF